MNEAEGRSLAAISKFGEPCEQWDQVRPNTYVNAFGVLNADEQHLKGLQVEFTVFISSYLHITKYVFTLKRFRPGVTERAYQLEINRRKNLTPADHAYSHEHYGEARFIADESWAFSDFPDAVRTFCEKINLKLTKDLPDYREFLLK